MVIYENGWQDKTEGYSHDQVIEKLDDMIAYLERKYPNARQVEEVEEK